MKVIDLLNEINHCKEVYGDDFLNWAVYTEQIDDEDKEAKREIIHSNGRKWGVVSDSEEWEYFECAGFWTKFEKERIFTINVNY
jgi:hypothetical protein